VKTQFADLSHTDGLDASSEIDTGAKFGVVPVKAMNSQQTIEKNRVRFIDRLRFQLGGGVIFCALGPIAARSIVESSSFYLPATFNTAVLSTFAIIIGFAIFRNVKTFPGAVPSTFALSTFATTFALAMIVPLILRIEYSWTQFLFHFAATMTFYGLVERRSGSSISLRFAVIPGGTVKRLPDLPNVHWHRLARYDDAISNVHGVVADLDTDHSAGWDAAMTRYLLAGFPVYHWKQLIEQLCGTVEIEHLSENHLGALNPNRLNIKMKTVIDFVLAAIALVVLSPIMLLIALIIKLESRGPAIFKQERTGFRAKTITVYKFRTMRNDHLGESGDAMARRLSAITQSNDSRITRVGKFLRKTRLDELPQLINVLKMEMSLIGPRPEAVSLTLWYEQELPFYHYRHIIKPGITGWAQINQGHVADIDDIKVKLAYDFYYVKYFSPWLDLLILVRTLVTAVTGRGAR
jgi:exopolysaccharide biosynthesis polyprenyl glycosylphosphotransferase